MSQRFYIPLQWLISMAITLSLLALSLILVTLSYQSTRATLLSATTSAAENASDLLDGQIEQLIQPVESIVAQLQFDPLVSAVRFEDRLKRVPALAQVLASNNVISAVYVGYPDGDFLLLRPINNERARNVLDAPDDAHFLLQSVERQNGETLGRWAWFDKQLRLKSIVIRPQYAFDPRTRPWFIDASASDERILTDPYVFYTTGEIGISLASQSATGAILAVDASVEDLSLQVKTLAPVTGTQLALVSEGNKVIGYEHVDQMILPDINGSLRLAELSELNLPALTDVATSSQPARTLFPVSINNQPGFGLWSPLSAFANENLRVLMAVPQASLLADAKALLRQQVGLSLLLVIALLPIGWWLGRRIGKPLRKLADQVEAIGRFEFEADIEAVHSNIREVHDLGLHTERMAGMITNFSRISQTLNRSTDLDNMISEVLHELASAVGATDAVVYLNNTEQTRLIRAGHVGPSRVPVTLMLGENPAATVRETLSRKDQRLTTTRLVNRSNHPIGVLALNRPEHTSITDVEFEHFMERMAGSVAIAIETRRLFKEQKALFDGIIRLLADAIDTKSPYTGGHCDRVPQVASILLNKVEAQTDGPFADFSLTAEERYEFTIAAWLHDCGKITTPEHVVDKATKLESLYNKLHEIRMRFEVLHRDAEIEYLADLNKGGNQQQRLKKRDRRQAQLQQDFAFIARLNLGSEARVSDDDIARMNQIGDQTWWRHFSDRIGISFDEADRLAREPEPPLPCLELLLANKREHREPWGSYQPPVEAGHPNNRWGFDMTLPEYAANHGERYNLSIRHGTLNDEERFKINNHIVETYRMLTTLPWPRHLARVPDIAANHHERMDGTGYPRKLDGHKMSVSERIMAIADVFEALTAADRPYKPAKTLSESLTIMVSMALNGHCDPRLLKVFIETGAYRTYAVGFLKPEQLDEVDEAALIRRLTTA